MKFIDLNRIFIAIAFFAVFSLTAAAQSDPVEAKDGGTYPVGTVLKAV